MIDQPLPSKTVVVGSDVVGAAVVAAVVGAAVVVLGDLGLSGFFGLFGLSGLFVFVALAVTVFLTGVVLTLSLGDGLARAAPTQTRTRMTSRVREHMMRSLAEGK